MKIQSSAVLLLLAISPPRTSQAFQLDSPLAATGTARSRIKSWRHPCRKLLTDHVFPCQLSPLVTTSIISRMSSYRHPFEGSGLTLKGEEEKNQSSDNQLEEGGNKPPSMPEQSPKGIYQIKNEEQYK